MGINKFFDYLISHKLARPYGYTQNTNSTLFIDGTNILCLFTKFPQGGRNSFDDVKNLIMKFLPTGLIHIFMDGESPMQKIQNQKSNYVQQCSQMDEKELARLEKWNKNTFTQFGKDINRQILYNGREEKGEAEHKIIGYIRDQKSQGLMNHDQKNYVISNDNDLIFLLLQFIDEDFSIIKIDINEKTKKATYYIVSIKEVREFFFNRIHQNCHRNDFDVERLSMDIIALSFFLGNDYVECFDEIYHCHNAFDLILDSYGQMNSRSSCAYHYLTDGCSFNAANLKAFATNLVSKLKNYLEQQKQQKMQRFRQKQMRLSKPKTIDNRNTKPNFNPFQKEAARDMIQALRWTLSYYLYGIPSWNYQYPKIKMINLNDFSILIDIVISKK